MTVTTNFFSADTAAKISALQAVLTEAEAIVIGAGAGLSTSDGYQYSGSWFTKHFADFVEKYGFTDAYSAGFYPFPTLAEKWAFWSRYIYYNRYDRAPGEVYTQLLDLVRERDYFVLTTNVDHCFQRTGFAKDRLFYTQGDFGLWQCSTPCHNQTYDNAETVLAMVQRQADMQVPEELIPYCPRCGAPMEMNLRADHRFVQSTGWYTAYENYSRFMEQHQNQKMLFMELGVGANTPAIIKYPFWKMTWSNPRATYISIALDATVPKKIIQQSILIRDDIGAVLAQLHP